MGQMKRLAILAAFFMAGPAWAQDCRNDPDILPRVIDGLKRGAGEVLAISSLSWRNTIVMTFANEKTGTWTMIEVHPNGNVCVIDYGTAATIAPVKGDL